MNGPSKEPAYNLKVVIKETGLKPDTLRAWERRYGLPNPNRTPGGHRLYSQYDIELIKWLIAREEEGLRINRAVKLWRSLEAQGRDPLEDVSAVPGSRTSVHVDVLSGTTLDEIRERWVEACRTFDEVRAENILAQAFARYSLETVCLEVLSRGLSDVGEQWYIGKSSVQQEHFASALAVRRLNTLIAATPVPTRRGKIIAACPPGEDHIFPLLLTTLLLRQRGWEVIYLGANVPISKLDATINATGPDLIISTAQQLFTAASLFEVAQFLVEQEVQLAFGGLIFNLQPELRDRVPGRFLGESLDDVVQSVEQIMAQAPKIPEAIQIPDIYLQAADHFKDHLPNIAADLWDQFQHNGMKEQHLEIANDFLGRDIEAGLILGDMQFLEHEIDWLIGLLRAHDVPVELLPKYLMVYKQAVEANLDQRGQLIIDWIESRIE